MSLTQGKQFNTFQRKIKKHTNKTNKKEGFVTLEHEQIVRPSFDKYPTVLTNNANQSDLDELKELQTRYNIVIQQYTELQKKISNSSLNTINRLDLNNPYLNKYLLFTDGTIVYVTFQGIAKKFVNEDVLNSVVGKNGCPPKNYIKLNIPWESKYIPGETIPTNPPLIVGSPMILGQSCGNEGSNVYASKLVNNPSSSYIGCYNDSSEATVIGNTSFEKCQEYAAENSYKYFGLQNIKSDGTASCLVSNDIQNYGDATIQTTLIPIWASNTAGSGATNCYVNGNGQVIINDVNGNIIWQSPNPPSDCLWGGYVNPDTIQGSFGGNCVGKPLNIDCKKQQSKLDSKESYSIDGIVGNLNTILSAKAKNVLNNQQENWVFTPLTEWTGSDPAFCCTKLVDYSYQCGGGPFKNGRIDGGSNIHFDCSKEVKNCSFFFILQLDGNLCLYRGSDPLGNTGNNVSIWSTMTNGKQISQNPDWVASNGKYGRSYLKINDVLNSGEWIGSDDGSLKLIMQTDGNLVLYTSKIKPGCVKGQYDKMYGINGVNAMYQMDNTGNKEILGKLGYVDSESNLREYPDSMIGFTNDYQIYLNTDSYGNDITSLITQEENGCQSACNNNTDCAAYAYQEMSQTCWLKNKSTFPNGEKQNNNNMVLGVRIPGLNGSANCSNKIINIDTIQYENYLKDAAMTENTQCNAPLVSHAVQLQFDNIKTELITLGDDIVSKMESLYDKDKTIFIQLNTNAQQFKKSLEDYKLTNLKIKKELNFQSNNIEGMQNLNNNDLNGMLSDSDLRVLQENYGYIIWSILAVGLLTVAINTIRK